MSNKVCIPKEVDKLVLRGELKFEEVHREHEFGHCFMVHFSGKELDFVENIGLSKVCTNESEGALSIADVPHVLTLIVAQV